jgi:outer membrane protein insertion porin family
MHFGVPLNERDTVGFGLTFDYTMLDLGAKSPQRYVDYCQSTQGCDNTLLRLDVNWAHDTRDNIVYPNRGVLQVASAEFGLPGLDQEYYKLNYQHVWYKDLTKTFTLMLKGEAGLAGSYGSKEFPFFKNFYAGGVSSVRGYDTSSIGPRDIDLSTGNDYSVGGTRRVVGNAELYFPVPFLKDNKQLKLSAFVDGGSVWGGNVDQSKGCDNSLSDCLRFSAGVGVSWYSPFGPIKIILAQPLNDKKEDKTQMLQFQMGSQF